MIPLRAILIGQPRTVGADGASDPLDRVFTTGIFKEPITHAVHLGLEGLVGDGQADRTVHGGPEKAVLVYSAKHFDFWRARLQRADVRAGAFGENFSVDTVTEEDVCIGDVFRVGNARVQVSQPRMPCWKLARRWRIKELPAWVQQEGKTGWYLRVLEEGEVQAGNDLTLLERPHPDWSVRRAHEVMHHQRKDRALAAELAAVAALTPGWRDKLQRRARGEEHSDSRARLVGPNEDP